MKHLEDTFNVVIAPNPSKELPLLQRGTVWIVLAILLSTFTAKSQIHSNANNDWNAGATWVGGVIPGAGDDVVIHHAVTISDNRSANSVTIINDAGVTSSLTVTAGTTTIGAGGVNVFGGAVDFDSELRLSNNAVLVINGDLQFTNSTTNNHNAILRLNSTSQLTVNGDFYYTYQPTDGTPEGITEIGLNSSSILTVTGDLTLIYNSTTKNSTLSFLPESNSQIHVNGNLNFLMSEAGTTGRIAMQFGTGSASTASMTIAGDLGIYNNDTSAPFSTQRNVLDARDATSVTVYGNIYMDARPATATASSNRLRIENASRLTLGGDPSDPLYDPLGGNLVFTSATANSTDNRFHIGVANVIPPTASFEIKGNVINPTQGRIETTGNTSFLFTGSVAQVIPQVNNSSDYFNILIDNSSGVALTLQTVISISGNLEMTNGIINSAASNRLILADAATCTGGTPTSYVINGLTKLGRSDITLPLGAGTRWAPLRFANIVDGNPFFTNFEVNYTGSGHPDPSCTLDPIIDHISGSEYWTIETTGTIPTSMDVIFYWKDACRSEIEDITSFPRDLYIAGYQTARVWDVPTSVIDVGSLDCSTAPYTGSITASLNSAFLTLHSDYAFAAVSAFVNPLPVELLSFKVEEDAFGEVVIKWETASELNSLKFVVEKSRDGKTWDAITQVEALGTSRVGKKYSITDLHPYSSTTYYRLAQFDLDGTRTYSSIKSLTLRNGSELNFSYYPNPAKDVLHINSSKRLSNVDVVIVNMEGSAIRRHHFPEFNWEQSILLTNLNAGLYYVTLLEKGRKLNSDALVINPD